MRFSLTLALTVAKSWSAERSRRGKFKMGGPMLGTFQDLHADFYI